MLAQTDPKALAPILTKALKDEDKGVRVTTVYALEGIADKVDGTVAALAGALKDSEKDVRIATAAVTSRPQHWLRAPPKGAISFGRRPRSREA